MLEPQCVYVEEWLSDDDDMGVGVRMCTAVQVGKWTDRFVCIVCMDN